MSVTVRGTSKAVGSNSISITLPSGSLAGDFGLLWVSFDWQFSSITPSGWTLLHGSIAGSGWNQATFYKVLTSSDISAGSLSISLPGAANSLAMMSTSFATGLATGFSLDVRSNARGATSGTSVALSDSVGAKAGDVAFYFGTNLTTSTDAVGRGSSNQVQSGGNSGCLYSEAIAANEAPLSATYTYSVSASSFQSTVIIGPMSPNARLTEAAREVMVTSIPNARTTYFANEVMVTSIPHAMITEIITEKMVSNAGNSQQPIIQVIT